MTKPWRPYARHILDTIAKIRRIQTKGDLVVDEILFDAALRNLQTLAEATQRLPEALKASHPAIPWEDISGFRNILVHNYLGEIDPLTVATIVSHDLVALEQAIGAMLSERPEEEKS